MSDRTFALICISLLACAVAVWVHVPELWGLPAYLGAGLATLAVLRPYPGDPWSRWLQSVILLGLLLMFVGIASADQQSPYLVRFEQPATVRTPAGALIDLPAGSEVGACGVGFPVDYDVDAQVFRVLNPCIVTTLFVDGFEAP